MSHPGHCSSGLWSRARCEERSLMLVMLAPCPLEGGFPWGNFKFKVGGSCIEWEITSLRCWPWKSPVLSAILYWKMAGFAKWQIGQETILIYFSPSDHLSKFISKRKFYLPFFIILTTSQVRQRNPRMLQFSLGKSNYGSWYYQQKAPLSIKCMSPVGLVNLLWIWLGKDRDPLAFFICWGLRFLSLLFPFLIFLVGLPFEFANTIHSLDF